ncbi:putative nuclease HARBI1 isoform X2 [Musca domestica]|uniref:Nuclease HARBI1 isoform X2 n=1 Tax=Musca domestica TaxID=7370 RepID=A0ABM3VP51_MUSDO|nr:putative nuclease HARBI1 isoform X2 [Musca domestica]
MEGQLIIDSHKEEEVRKRSSLNHVKRKLRTEFVLIQFYQLPTTPAEWERIAEEFSHKWNFPHCIGAIDGKHVVIKKTPKSGSAFYNYKKFFSIVLLGVVNANYEFIMVDVGTNGRYSDGGVFSNSSFGEAFVSKNLKLPEPKPVPMSEKVLPYVFIADDAFSLTENMMKPFSQIGLSSEKRIFNYRLSRARRVVENVFGILVSRFGVLQRAIQLSPEKTETVVLACCYLHKFLRRQCGDKYISGLLETENTETGSINHGSWRTRETFSSSLPNSHSRNASNNAKTIREEFRDYFNHENIVPWQNKFVN